MPPRQPQQARARGLHGLGARVPLDGLRGEGHGGGDRSFGVGVGELAEQLVIQRRVNRDYRQDVGGEGERINSDTQAEGVNLGGVEGSGKLVGEGPGVVVDRSMVGVVVFGVPTQLLGEFADDAAPQGEVVTRCSMVPRPPAGRPPRVEPDTCPRHGRPGRRRGGVAGTSPHRSSGRTEE